MKYRTKDIPYLVLSIIFSIACVPLMCLYKNFMPSEFLNLYITLVQFICVGYTILGAYLLVITKKGLKVAEELERVKREQIEEAGREILYTYIASNCVLYVTSLGIECYYREKFSGEIRIKELKDFYIEKGDIIEVKLNYCLATLTLRDGTNKKLGFSGNKDAANQFEKELINIKKQKS